MTHIEKNKNKKAALSPDGLSLNTFKSDGLSRIVSGQTLSP